MAPKQELLYKVKDTFVSPLSGEVLYAVNGVIRPKRVPYVTITCGVFVEGVHLSKNLWPFQSDELCKLLDARRRWYRWFPRRLEVNVLIRLIPNTDPNWPGPMMPEVIRLSAKGFEAVFENTSRKAAESPSPV